MTPFPRFPHIQLRSIERIPLSKRWMCQGACAPEFFRFRHPRRAEDAHSAFHWWCLWQCAAFGLSANRWCRRPVPHPTIDLELQMCEHFRFLPEIILRTSLQFWCNCSAWYIFSGTPLKEFAFRPLFPHERCDEALWVWSPAC